MTRIVYVEVPCIAALRVIKVVNNLKRYFGHCVDLFIESISCDLNNCAIFFVIIVRTRIDVSSESPQLTCSTIWSLVHTSNETFTICI